MGKAYHGDSEEEETSAIYKSGAYIYTKKPESNSLECNKCKKIVDVPFVVEWLVYCQECKPSNGVFDENLAKLAGDLEVFCSNWSKGCSVQLMRKDLPLHLKTCQGSTFKCTKSIFGCSFSGTKTEMAAHKCEVNSDTIIQTLTQLVFEQQKDIRALKFQLSIHDGYFLDMNDDLTGISATIGQMKIDSEVESKYVHDLSKFYILPNKLLQRLDLSREDIDLSVVQWTEDSLLDVMFRLTEFQFYTLRFPFNSQTANTLTISSLMSLCLKNGRCLRCLTLIGDKSKLALPVSDEFISFLTRCPIGKLRFENFSFLYFDAYIRSILKANNNIKIELINCTYDIQHERLKLSQ